MTTSHKDKIKSRESRRDDSMVETGVLKNSLPREERFNLWLNKNSRGKISSGLRVKKLRDTGYEIQVKKSGIRAISKKAAGRRPQATGKIIAGSIG